MTDVVEGVDGKGGGCGVPLLRFLTSRFVKSFASWELPSPSVAAVGAVLRRFIVYSSVVCTLVFSLVLSFFVCWNEQLSCMNLAVVLAR